MPDASARLQFGEHLCGSRCRGCFFGLARYPTPFVLSSRSCAPSPFCTIIACTVADFAAMVFGCPTSGIAAHRLGRRLCDDEPAAQRTRRGTRRSNQTATCYNGRYGSPQFSVPAEYAVGCRDHLGHLCCVLRRSTALVA